jgi:polysaccharide deacetylase 2 family uncharacterized protein YibQ
VSPRLNKRRRTGSRRSRSRPGRRWRLVAAGVLAVALGLVGFFYVGGPRLRELVVAKMPVLEPAPPYEQPLELPDQLARIDHAFYVALFRLGVEEENVSFESVKRQRQEGREWEQARVRVGLPRGVSFQESRVEFARALAPLGKRLELIWKPKGKQVDLELHWDGLLTHRVQLERGPLRLARAKAAERLPRVALVMDDLGYDPDQVQRLIDLELPLTCSVLPHSPYGHQIAASATEAGLECLLHLPMEAEGLPRRKLGEGVLLMDMDAGQLLRTLREDLDDLPEVSGVNNHMGSLLTANEPRMKVVLGELKRRHLFFLDSRTTSHSLGYSLARQMGVRAAVRSVFLDNVQEKDAVLAQLAKLVSVARSEGQAVAICHPYPATFAALGEGLPQLGQKVQLVKVSALAQ